MRHFLIRLAILCVTLGSVAQAHIQLVEQVGSKLVLRFLDADAAALKELVGGNSIKANKEDSSTIRSLSCRESVCECELNGELQEVSPHEFFLSAPPESGDVTATHTEADAIFLQILVDGSYKNKTIKMKKSKRGDVTASTLQIPIMETEAKVGSLTIRCGNRLGLWTKPFILQSSCTVQGSVSK
jgi:hypothetical protein